MSTFFRNKLESQIGITPVVVLQATALSKNTVIGLSLTNITEFPVNINVSIIDDSSTEVYYARNVVVPSESSLRVVTNGEKLIIPPDYSLKVWADEEMSIDAAISYLEIT